MKTKFQIKNPKMFISATLGVLIINIYPLIMLIIRSFSVDVNGGFTTEHYTNALTAFGNIQTLQNSLIYAAGSIAIALFFALISALSNGRVNVPFKRFVDTGSAITYVSPPWVAAMAYVFLLAPNSGLLNIWMEATFGFKLFNVMTMAGMIFVTALFYYPYIYMTVSSALENMDSSYEEAAMTVGCSPLRTLLKVTLPLVTPAITTSVVFSFVMVWGLFSIPAMLGSPSKVYVFATYLNTLMNSLVPQFELSAALSVMFAIVAAILVTLGLKLAKSGQSGRYQTVGSKGHNSMKMEIGRWKYLLAGLNIFIIFLTLILPYCCLVIMSLSKTVYEPFSLSNMTLNNYKLVLDSNFVKILGNTLELALYVAVICCLIAIVIAYLNLRSTSKLTGTLNFMTTLPIAIPSVAFTIGVSAAWMGQPFSLYGSIWIMVLAQVARFISMAMRHFEDGFNQLHSSLEEGAKTCGASSTTTLMKISLPIMRPVLVNTFLVVFMSSMRDLLIPLFLGTGTVQTMTLATRIYSYWNEGMIPEATSLCIVLVVVMSVIYQGSKLLFESKKDRVLRKEKKLQKQKLKQQKAA